MQPYDWTNEINFLQNPYKDDLSKMHSTVSARVKAPSRNRLSVDQMSENTYEDSISRINREISNLERFKLH